MKRVYITVLVTALFMTALFAALNAVWTGKPSAATSLKVGFIYDGDESAPYSYNFSLAQAALERDYAGVVTIASRSNVPEAEIEEPLRDLVREGCKLIFTNSYSEKVLALAAEYPEVQFCQTSFYGCDPSKYPANYHTFNGYIHQARYVTGIAAGLKLRDMIDSRTIDAADARIGYVGAFPTAEILSGCTAFLLGVRSVAPEAVMEVKYTGTWNSYAREKACAKALIEDGCVVICQHTDTFGPAIACEEYAGVRPVFHVGINQSMIGVAPTTSLISARVNWVPYVTGAVDAVLAQKPIEKSLKGDVHGNDIGAGFDQGWVQVLDLNKRLAVYGTQEKLDKAIEGFRKGNLVVFRGDYTGTDPNDPGDTCDLRGGYRETVSGSWATFHYVLDDVVTVSE